MYLGTDNLDMLNFPCHSGTAVRRKIEKTVVSLQENR